MTIETELPTVKVKALEWTHEDDGEYIAYSEIGWYHIRRPASFWNLTVPCGEVPSFETLEAAQAAAQQDYSARIISAITLKDGNGAAESRCAELAEALERSMVAINDWLHVYAPDECREADVAESRARLRENGTLWYIANVQEQNHAALSQYRKGSEADD